MIFPTTGTIEESYSVSSRIALEDFASRTIYPSSSRAFKIACTVEVDLIPVAAQISLTVGGKPDDISLTRKLYTLSCFSVSGVFDIFPSPNEHLFSLIISFTPHLCNTFFIFRINHSFLKGSLNSIFYLNTPSKSLKPDFFKIVLTALPPFTGINLPKIFINCASAPITVSSRLFLMLLIILLTA